MRTTFYLPGAYLPSAEKRAAWERGDRITLEEGGKAAAVQCWIYQTWLALRQRGFTTELSDSIPDEGLLVALTGTLAPDFRAPRDLFVAGIVADGLPHPGAHVHIVQNALHARRLNGAVFMPLWPQPGLQPRNEARGDKFKRVAFFGHAPNLAPELRDEKWQQRVCAETGALFEIRSAGHWDDYRDVDAVVAIRDFRGGRQMHKPSTKLYNAWLAGVPFIGGTDSSYAADGHPGEDYLVARSPEDVIDHLRRLARDRQFASQLVARGRQSVRDFTPEAISVRWRRLLEDLPERAARHRALPEWRQMMADMKRGFVCAADRIFRR